MVRTVKPVGWNASVWTKVLARFGYWTWEHEFKTCPTGERHCPHMHWRPGRG